MLFIKTHFDLLDVIIKLCQFTIKEHSETFLTLTSYKTL